LRGHSVRNQDASRRHVPIESKEQIMKTNKRFIKSVTTAAASTEVCMPWARGARRAAFIAKRSAPLAKVKTA
jgi:hypothetical protein